MWHLLVCLLGCLTVVGTTRTQNPITHRDRLSTYFGCHFLMVSLNPLHCPIHGYLGTYRSPLPR